MKIAVISKDTLPDKICVDINGFCNHESYEYVELDVGYPDATVGDYIEALEDAKQCNKCDALYDMSLEIWECKS